MPKRFVWVEDDWPIMMPLMEPLKEEGHELVIFRTKKEVLDNINIIKSADLIIVDLIIPYGDRKVDPFRHAAATDAGMSLIGTLVKTHEVSVPILVLSIVRNPGVHRELQKLGVRKIMLKPVLVSELEDAVTEILGKDWHSGHRSQPTVGDGTSGQDITPLQDTSPKS